MTMKQTQVSFLNTIFRQPWKLESKRRGYARILPANPGSNVNIHLPEIVYRMPLPMNGQGNLDLYSSFVVSGSSAKHKMRQCSNLKMLSQPFCEVSPEISLEKYHLFISDWLWKLVICLLSFFTKCTWHFSHRMLSVLNYDTCATTI